MVAIDDIVIRFKPEQLVFLNICLAFLMFGVALDLRLDQFRILLRQPRKPLLGLTSQWILLPLLTIGLILVFRPSASLALGMILVACCPGGNVSNYAVHLAGANTPLSVIMTTISTLGATIITPLYFSAISAWLPETRDMAREIYVPLIEMMSTILTLIVFPLVAGMLLRAYLPGVTDRINGVVKGLSMVIFIGFVVVAIASNWTNLVNYLYLVFFLVLLHNALALLTGYGFGRLTGMDKSDSRTLSIETGIQNSGLALLLIFNFFDGLGGMAIIAAWWGTWHLISAFSLAMYWRNRPLSQAVPAG